MYVCMYVTNFFFKLSFAQESEFWRTCWTYTLYAGNLFSVPPLLNQDNLKNEDDIKDEDDFKNKDDLKNEDDVKNEDNIHNEDDINNEDNSQNGEMLDGRVYITWKNVDDSSPWQLQHNWPQTRDPISCLNRK